MTRSCFTLRCVAARHRCVVLVSVTLLAFLCSGEISFAEKPQAIDFARQIRPILAAKCLACHGPDEKARKGGLRLDIRKSATKELESGEVAVAPGKPRESELVRRINTPDASERMPPKKSKKTLSDAEKELLARWIAEGAKYKIHWAFSAPVRATAPAIKKRNWPLGDIDKFVLARLEAEKIEPSPAADRVTLIRRLSFDLRGLPPAVSEVDEFLADKSPQAYERLVDKLLKSPHFGEKLAQDWLDLARYGDSNGYHNDSHRDMWLYRDWVIHAFITNMPYDRFVIEQIAGDLLPGATAAQKIASGFNRNNTFNEEGGADPDEFYVSYAVDRANTTGQTFLGLTVGCAQCHDHKYDPISQREYYRFYAFFNSIKGEVGAGGENGYHNKPLPPLLKARSPLAAGNPAAGREATTMVMKQMKQRKPAFFLVRGDFQQRGEQLQPGVPAVFPPLPSDKPRNRLGLAHWLVRRDHPLVSRVRVNHLWKLLFGTGLVRTAGDFGTQGELPSHPKLLDWLAIEFIESGWDTKVLLKKIVMSATYRQASTVKGRVVASDPYNRLLSRAPRFRLSAEEIRDVALATSGLLKRSPGGPSVRPYQPANFYADKIGKRWNQSKNDDLYRRGLYTYWQRTAPYPSFIIFDAPSREICMVRRPRTNTPLQALVTMNDPVFVEAARVLGEHVVREGGKSTSDRMLYVFRRVLSRRPSQREIDALSRIVARQRDVYAKNPESAKQLIATGQHPVEKNLDPVEVAAWTNVASVLLNLDEAITRE